MKVDVQRLLFKTLDCEYSNSHSKISTRDRPVRKSKFRTLHVSTYNRVHHHYIPSFKLSWGRQHSKKKYVQIIECYILYNTTSTCRKVALTGKKPCITKWIVWVLASRYPHFIGNIPRSYDDMIYRSLYEVYIEVSLQEHRCFQAEELLKCWCLKRLQLISCWWLNQKSNFVMRGEIIQTKMWIYHQNIIKLLYK